jgi:hypothetical protein
MLSKSQQRQFGELCNASFGDDPLAITAGAGQDGLENDGLFVPIPTATIARPESAVPILVYKATLADTVTLTLNALNGRDATDAAGAGAADFDTGSQGHQITSAVLLATGKSGGTVIRGAFRGPTLSLVGARTHIQFQYTLSLSSGSLDLLAVQLMILWGGFGVEPTLALVEDSNV